MLTVNRHYQGRGDYEIGGGCETRDADTVAHVLDDLCIMSYRLMNHLCALKC